MLPFELYLWCAVDAFAVPLWSRRWAGPSVFLFALLMVTHVVGIYRNGTSLKSWTLSSSLVIWLLKNSLLRLHRYLDTKALKDGMK